MITTLNFTRKRMNINLLMGILWLSLGSLGVLFIENTTNIISYCWIVLGAIYFITFIWERRNQYATITEKSITKNKLKPINIELKNIVRVQKFASDVKIFSEKKKIIINTNLITEESKTDLDKFLKTIDLEIG